MAVLGSRSLQLIPISDWINFFSKPPRSIQCQLNCSLRQGIVSFLHIFVCGIFRKVPRYLGRSEVICSSGAESPSNPVLIPDLDFKWTFSVREQVFKHFRNPFAYISFWVMACVPWESRLLCKYGQDLVCDVAFIRTKLIWENKSKSSLWAMVIFSRHKRLPCTLKKLIRSTLAGGSKTFTFVIFIDTAGFSSTNYFLKSNKSFALINICISFTSVNVRFNCFK